jgi:transcriptional regulator with XRE-family HTH domain
MLANYNLYSIEKTPSAIQQEIALKVRVLRKQVGYSQADLATRSGVSLGSIKRFERTGQISFESLLKVAYLLGRLVDFDPVFKSKEVDKSIQKLFTNNRT